MYYGPFLFMNVELFLSYTENISIILWIYIIKTIGIFVSNNISFQFLLNYLNTLWIWLENVFSLDRNKILLILFLWFMVQLNMEYQSVVDLLLSFHLNLSGCSLIKWSFTRNWVAIHSKGVYQQIIFVFVSLQSKRNMSFWIKFKMKRTFSQIHKRKRQVSRLLKFFVSFMNATISIQIFG